jgi:4-hydroxy-4-methyl-2-oxoglutarate aldolase
MVPARFQLSLEEKPLPPGDFVIGDDDGLCTLTSAQARELIGAAEAKLALEAQWQEKLARGMSVKEAFGLT